MFLDTHSKNSMEQSVCNYLSISLNELNNTLEKASLSASNGLFFNGNIFDNVINDFICSHLPMQQIDEILFFHLGRRLHNADSIKYGSNLYDLLTQDSELCRFLNQHKVTFQPKDGHLELYYNEQYVSLENTYETKVSYLRSRLGYISGRQDYCFNGFAFKDLLYKNHYAQELSDVPEFIGVLADFLNKRRIGTDYYENSTYYCYEYCVPIEFVLFDNNQGMVLEDKKIYIVNQIFNRLHYYLYSDITYMSDDENPILRLKDFVTMDEKYFVGKEKITDKMLRCY